MEYGFLAASDEALLEGSKLPREGVLAVAVRSTGYDVAADEVVELAIVDLQGHELFCRRVHPQNVEEWPAGDASGDISPADVADAPELYQFEEEISQLVENASIVVAAHVPFAEAMIEQSWVTLPSHESFDLVERFLASHSSQDRPGQPAVAASLPGIAEYYGLACEDASLVDVARTVARCYEALVDEHVRQREAKGADYWRRYDERKAEEAKAALAGNVVAQKRERYLNRMNGLLWLSGAIIFTSLAIQTYQGGGDTGLLAIFAAIAVLNVVFAVRNFLKR